VKGPSAWRLERGYPLAKRYNTAPSMQIDPAKSYQANFHTSRGDFTVDLFAKDAPITVNNFVFLAPVS
jgi:hypothetical protein